MDFANVKLKLDKCLDKLYSKDKDLFFYKTNDPKAAERCLTFRLGYYLQNEFKNYNVDSEYNRHIKNVKVLDDKNVFPDLIIHKRLNDDNNLLWIEIKKKENDCKDDIVRLKKVTSNEYMYKYGAMIVLKKQEPKVIYYENGNEIGSG